MSCKDFPLLKKIIAFSLCIMFSKGCFSMCHMPHRRDELRHCVLLIMSFVLYLALLCISPLPPVVGDRKGILFLRFMFVSKAFIIASNLSNLSIKFSAILSTRMALVAFLSGRVQFLTSSTLSFSFLWNSQVSSFALFF